MIALIGELDVLEALGAAAPFGLADGSLAGLSDSDALAGLVLAERLGRLVDSVRVTFAGEIAARCGIERGDERLSVRSGFPTAAKLMAECTGTSIATAADRARLGAAVRSEPSFGGGSIPSRFAKVAAALRSGDLGIDSSEVITRTLGQAAKQVGFTDELAAAEAYLVQAAAQTAGGLGFTANQIGTLAVNLRDRLDPDGVRPRDDRLNEQRCLKFVAQPSGMTKLIGLLPPEDAASWLAIDAATQSPRVRPSFPTARGEAVKDAPSSSGADGSGGSESDVTGSEGLDSVFADPRTPNQRRADVFTDLVRKAATLPDVPRLNGASATISVHADLDDIAAGRGVGWIPGITEPLPAASVQQLLCHADMHTTVFGEGGRVLCQGKTQRLFTTMQVRAMAARDGGCVWPGCDRPPSWCESHHAEPWRSVDHAPGRTDVENGVLICHFHHRIVHTSDWQLTMIDGVPHFLPPASIDWQRTPRAATQQRTRTRLRPLRLADLPERTEPWRRRARDTA